MSMNSVNVLIVDTSIWIDFFRGSTFPNVELALKEARIILSPLVVAELMSGSRNVRDANNLRVFLAELQIHHTPFEHWVTVGRLRNFLANQGINVSIPDAHIAQCTLDLGGYLVSHDRIFQKIASQIDLSLLSP